MAREAVDVVTERERLAGAVDAALWAMRGMILLGKRPAMQWAIFRDGEIRAEVFPPPHGDDRERFLAMRVATFAAALRADMISVAAEAATKPIDVEQIVDGSFVRPNEDPGASLAIVCIAHGLENTLAGHQVMHRDDDGTTTFDETEYRWNDVPMLGPFADALRAGVRPIAKGEPHAAQDLDPRIVAQYLSREEGFAIALLDP